MARTLTAAVHRDDAVYVARALEVGVASQGPTIEAALAALREALELYFEDDTSRDPAGRPWCSGFALL